jgi:hypothetical protein
MLLRSLLASSASILLVTSASAVTLDPGKTYVGDLTVNFEDVAFLPEGFVYENIRNLRAQQLNSFFIDDLLDPGEGYTVSLEGSLATIAGDDFQSIFSTANGFSPELTGLSFAFTYMVEIITSAVTTVTIDRIQLQSVADADFTGPNGETGLTNLSYFSTIVNIREVGDGPVDPPPNVIPLPAAGWALLTGVGALVAIRRRKTS